MRPPLVRAPAVRTPFVLALALAVGGFVLAPAGLAGPTKRNKYAGPLIDARPAKVEPFAALGVSMPTLSLSDAPRSKASAAPAPAVKTTRLDDDEVRELLRRLPEMTADDVRAFAFRKQTRKRPLPGSDKTTSFPPAVKRPRPLVTKLKIKKTPLTVLRRSPEGEVQIAAKVSITFSEPMVPLTAVDDDTLRKIPATLSPKVPGRWQWLDTKTLQFLPEKPFALSTRFKVSIPAGTRSASGTRLKKAERWSFETARNRFSYGTPSGNQNGLRPTLSLRFTQPIRRSEVTAVVRVKAGGRSVGVKLKADPKASAVVEPGQPVDLVLPRALPRDAAVEVVVGPKIPSALGPLRGQEQGKFTFRTYPPLRVTGHGCTHHQCVAYPGLGYNVSFSSSLEAKAFNEAQVTVTPRPEGLTVSAAGASLAVRGTFAVGKEYTVVVNRGVTDVWGQRLTGNRSFRFKPKPVPQPEPHASLSPTGAQMWVADPDGKAEVKVSSSNQKTLEVLLYKVSPEDWPRYQAEFVQRFWHYESSVRAKARMPGRLIKRVTRTLTATTNVPEEVVVDLSPALDGKRGHAVALIKGVDHQRSHAAWVQVTELGLTVFNDGDQLVGWATRLRDGAALRSASVKTFPQGKSRRADAMGVANLGSPKGKLAIVRQGRDAAFLPRNYWSNGYQPNQQLSWLVVDDRKLYRPGEQVHVKGWVRTVDRKKYGDVALPGWLKTLGYRVVDAMGNELQKGTLKVSRRGSFDLAIKLEDDVGLGQAWVAFQPGERVPSRLYGTSYQHRFRIEEFRRPEFEVEVLPDGEYRFGDDIVLPLRARYYSGGPLPQAPTQWQVRLSQTTFVPPGRSGWTFGTRRANPMYGGYDDEGYGRGRGGRGGRGLVGYFPGPQVAAAHASQTGPLGVHRLKVDLGEARPPWPVTLGITATVTDVNRRPWTTTTSVVVHPANVYLGLKSARSFVEPGQDVLVDALVSDVKGRGQKGNLVEVRAYRTAWKVTKKGWVTERTDEQVCQLLSLARGTRCRFKSTGSGQFHIRGIVRNAREAVVGTTDLQVWVSGGYRQQPGQGVAQQLVTVLADKEAYDAGETAEVLVQAPWPGATGVMTLRRGGVIEKQGFKLKGRTRVFRIPLKDAHVPGLTLQIDLVGQAARLNERGLPEKGAPPRPAYASGRVDLKVTTASRRLEVDVSPAADIVAPGEETSVTVKVRDPQGRALRGAEVLLVAVDESVLALTGYKLPDPLAPFYPARIDPTRMGRVRQLMRLTDLADLMAQSPATAMDDGDADGAGFGIAAESAPAASKMASVASRKKKAGRGAGPSGGSGGGAAKKVALRRNFSPLLVFAPDKVTDRRGVVRLKVKLPDSLTRYRLTAIVAHGAGRFGKGESRLVAQKPLMIRPSAPRFLNYGDELELPIVVQNLSRRPASVKLALKTSNLELTAGGGRAFTLPGRGRAEIRFPARAFRPGTARFAVIAQAGKAVDAAEISLPVYTPATSEAFAVYGTLDAGAFLQPVKPPKDVAREFGGLEVSTSSTALHSLTDAYLYLARYPYEGCENVASRLLGIVSLRDVMTAFKTPGLPSASAVQSFVEGDIKLLEQRQNSDGGWHWWVHDSVPYTSIHAMHALERSRLKKVAVAEGVRNRGLSYLRKIEANIAAYERRHHFTYGKKTRNALKAYALYVRSLAGDDVRNDVTRELEDPGYRNLTVETVGWLLSALSRSGGSTSRAAKDLVRHLQNRAEETAAEARFVARYGQDAKHLLLHSDRRTDAVVLEALIASRPDDTLIPKVVRGLMSHRLQGRWGNTQENALILVALERYFSTYESVTPDFVARLWLGDQYAGEQAYRGRSAERQHLTIPMAVVLDEGEGSDLLLSKEGAGRLYYRLGMTYAPKSLKLEALDRGFSVQRTYEAVEDPAEVTQRKDGTWQFKAGALVRVKLTMRSAARRHHVALVDKLPAGLEAITAGLKGTAPAAAKPASHGWWWWRTHWYEHEMLRDERAEAHTTVLNPGEYTFSYVARATTPGRFVAPPVKAEEVYTPETFGRSSVDFVIVKE